MMYNVSILEGTMIVWTVIVWDDETGMSENIWQTTDYEEAQDYAYEIGLLLADDQHITVEQE